MDEINGSEITFTYFSRSSGIPREKTFYAPPEFNFTFRQQTPDVLQQDWFQAKFRLKILSVRFNWFLSYFFYLW